MKNFLIFGFLFFCTGCGGGGNNPATLGGGQIYLSVANALDPSLSKAVQIAKYTVTLEGDGMSPVVQTVDAGTKSVVINDIPVGVNRHVKVAALSGDGKILRDGIVDHIMIEGGKRADVAVTLQSIPVVLNAANNDHISNRRLYFQIFSDPQHNVTVEEDHPIQDILTSLNAVPTDETGVARIYPGLLPPGEHHFTIRDVTTGRYSTLTLNLWDGDKIRGVSFFAASNVRVKVGEDVGKR